MPKMFEGDKAQGRIYTCKCELKKHPDIVSAMNIRDAPVIDDKGQST